MVFVSMVDRVFDHTQPARPWAELAAEGFAPPIRENWRFRIIVNLVWFARNYLNMCVAMVLAVAYWFPGFLAPVGITVFMHSGERTKAPLRRRILQLAQLGSFCLNTYLYGWLSGFLFSVLIATVILLHAVFTPYTDERVKRYNDVVAGVDPGAAASSSDDDRPSLGGARNTANNAPAGHFGFAPRTPVMTYTGPGTGNFPVDDTELDAAREDQDRMDAADPATSAAAPGSRRQSVLFDTPVTAKETYPATKHVQGIRRRSGFAQPQPRRSGGGTLLASSLPDGMAMGAWNTDPPRLPASVDALAAATEPPPTMTSPTSMEGGSLST